MASQPGSGSSTPARRNQPSKEMKEVKILMLHGYTQSGPLFHAKTRALEKMLQKSLAPFAVAPTLIYPTAPIRLSPQDIPGWTAPSATAADGETQAPPPPEEAEIDSWSWFRRAEALQRYAHIESGMGTIATAIREAGGVDGVLGFSQGGAMAALVAAALDGQERKTPDEDKAWLDALRDANAGKLLKFAVIYSGFYSWDKVLAGWMYDPKIGTPTLHYIGSLDTVVDEERSRLLADQCVDPVVVVHPGGHHVPVSKEWAMPLVGFVKKYAEHE